MQCSEKALRCGMTRYGYDRRKRIFRRSSAAVLTLIRSDLSSPVRSRERRVFWTLVLVSISRARLSDAETMACLSGLLIILKDSRNRISASLECILLRLAFYIAVSSN